MTVGTGFLLIPNQLLDLFGIESTSEVWIRVVGLGAVALGIIYFNGDETTTSA